MSERAVVSIFCANRPGLLGAVAARLFGLGCNLAETTFAILSGSAKLTAVCDPPRGLERETLWLELERLPALAGGRITVSPFSGPDTASAAERITHRIEFAGVDRPGLILRLNRVFDECGAAVLRLNTHAAAAPDGGARQVIRFAVALDPDAVDACLAAAREAAAEIDMECRVEPA